MRVVIQKVTYSSVTVDKKLSSEIKDGLTVLVGFTEGDSSKEIDYLVDNLQKVNYY